MGVFTYTATDLDRSVTTGTVVADTPRQARDQLRECGLSVHEIAEQAGAGGPQRWPCLPRPRASSGGRQATMLVRELSTLVGVGMPLLEALDVASRQQSRRFKPVLLDLRDRIAGGLSLAEAMRQQPEVFDEITVAMTGVGEDAGTLDVTLGELAEFKERSAQFRGKVSSALTCLAIVLGMAVAVSLFLMTYVVPQLIGPLAEAGRDLPLITQVVKAVSDMLVSWWWALLVGAGTIGTATIATASTDRGKRLLHRALLNGPRSQVGHHPVPPVANHRLARPTHGAGTTIVRPRIRVKRSERSVR